MPTGSDFQDVRLSSTAPENRQFSNKMPVDPLEVYQGAEDQLAKDLELQHFLMNSGMTPGSPHTDHPMNGPFSPPAPLPQYGQAPEKSYEPVPVSYPRPGREPGEEIADPAGMTIHEAKPVVRVG
jgi:hypothetical protein